MLTLCQASIQRYLLQPLLLWRPVTGLSVIDVDENAFFMCNSQPWLLAVISHCLAYHGNNSSCYLMLFTGTIEEVLNIKDIVVIFFYLDNLKTPT